MKGGTILRLIIRGALRLRPTSRLSLPLAILAGLLAMGNTLCGGDRSIELDALRRAGVPRVVTQWSRDGNHIAFEATESGKSSGIYVVRSDGSRLRRVSASSGDWDVDYWPDISPDGSRVVYTTSRHGRTQTYGRVPDYEIETSKLDGSDRRRLTENTGNDVSPMWAPDGARIAFLNRGDDGYDKIVVMAADGSDKRNVLDIRTFDLEDLDLEEGLTLLGIGMTTGPVWSPDGEALSFVGGAYGKELEDRVSLSVLYTLRADGGIDSSVCCGFHEGFLRDCTGVVAGRARASLHVL